MSMKPMKMYKINLQQIKFHQSQFLKVIYHGQFGFTSDIPGWVNIFKSESTMKDIKRIQNQEIVHTHHNVLIKSLGQNFIFFMIENSEKTINRRITLQGDKGDMRQVYS